MHLKQHKITFPAVYGMHCFVKRNIYNSDETFYAFVLVKEIFESGIACLLINLLIMLCILIFLCVNRMNM